MIGLVGCGFLGSIFATELAKLMYAGKIGDEIRLVDFDKVEDRNAANQNFTLRDHGRYKYEAVSKALSKMGVPVFAMRPEKLAAENMRDILGACRLVVDAVDNLATRQLLWAYAKQSNTPVLHIGLSLNGEGRVEWTTGKHDTFSLSPAALNGRTPADPPSGTQPPCELVRFRAAGWMTAYHGAVATAVFFGFDPMAHLEGADSFGWMTDWLTTAEGVRPRREVWARHEAEG